jgi:nucleotide-binding universal stress UspA family protein
VINPLRSEQDAFRFTMIVAALVAPVIVAALVFSSAAALGVAAGLALGVAGGLFLLKRNEPEPKMQVRRPEGAEMKRILVVANETLTGRALRNEIAHRIGTEAAQVLVVCPALNTKLKHWVSDEDEARRHAQERLDSVVRQLERDGVSVEGDIGDGDPVQAIEDALRLFPADEVIISTHPPGRSNWLERGVVQRARERVPLPVTHVVVDLEHEREFVAQRDQ